MHLYFHTEPNTSEKMQSSHLLPCFATITLLVYFALSVTPSVADPDVSPFPVQCRLDGNKIARSALHRRLVAARFPSILDVRRERAPSLLKQDHVLHFIEGQQLTIFPEEANDMRQMNHHGKKYCGSLSLNLLPTSDCRPACRHCCWKTTTRNLSKLYAMSRPSRSHFIVLLQSVRHEKNCKGIRKYLSLRPTLVAILMENISPFCMS